MCGNDGVKALLARVGRVCGSHVPKVRDVFAGCLWQAVIDDSPPCTEQLSRLVSAWNLDKALAQAEVVAHRVAPVVVCSRHKLAVLSNKAVNIIEDEALLLGANNGHCDERRVGWGWQGHRCLCRARKEKGEEGRAGRRRVGRRSEKKRGGGIKQLVSDLIRE